MAQQHGGQAAFAALTQALGGLLVGRCLTSVARFEVADVLGDVPQTAEELAAATDTNPDALGRMLGLLAAHGVFACDGEHFTHTEASRLLRGSHPQSMRKWVVLLGTETGIEHLRYADYTLQTGNAAVRKLHPGGVFSLLVADPEFGRQFHAAMADKARGQIAAVTAACDFSGCKTIADIGGGLGHLLQAVLQAAPQAEGVLFDLPSVIEQASTAASARLTLRAGDFFTDPLPSCDTYLVMDVLHDWDDVRAAAILAAVRSAAPEHARVLVIETVTGDAWSRALDVMMLLFNGGRQRTRSEHETLLHAAGLRLTQVIPAGADVSVIEAVPA